MSTNQHRPDDANRALNQNNQMSNDPDDGSRNASVLGREGGATAAEKKPPHDRQDRERIEAYGERGAGSSEG